MVAHFSAHPAVAHRRRRRDSSSCEFRHHVCPVLWMLIDNSDFFVQPPRGSSSSVKKPHLVLLRGRRFQNMAMLVLTVRVW